MFDVIGDVHGYAEPLCLLLEKMDYRQAHGVYQHSERRVIFLGDFIDRGPQIREVLQIVRPMIEAGTALAVIGNHELNAIAYHTRDSQGEYLRPHSEKNIQQHVQTVQQLTEGALPEALQWFRTLPLWLELPGLRVVHACWDSRSMDTISAVQHPCSPITNEFLELAYHKGTPTFAAVETVLKGREAPLPPGVWYFDKEGQRRSRFRVRWYLPPQGHTYASYSFEPQITSELPLPEAVIAAAEPYPTHAPPVFIGHYWLRAQQPALLADNVACLDYSVAGDGFLCAYRWSGEQRLRNESFVTSR